MSEIIQALLKRSSVFVIAAGIVLLIVGASGGINIGSLSLQIANQVAQWVIIITSVVLVLIGLFWETKSGLFSETGKLDNKNRQLSMAKVYKTRPESYEVFLNSLNNATESIDIISYVNLRAADAKRSKFYDALYTAVFNRLISHQRIVWNLDQLEWLEQMLKIGWDNLPEFSVKYYHVDPSKTPITTFDIIDQKIVFMGQGWLLEGHLELKGADVGEFFRAYFAGLWNKSEPLKERGKPANKKRIKELIQELSKNG